jgi:hypothetical protein
MAHGGTPAWNASVHSALAGLPETTPVALAYGMANPYTLAASLDSLRSEGVDRVAVVRVFLSGKSFLQQTKYFLGLDQTPPEAFVLMGPAASDPDARSPIEHSLQVSTHTEGLMDDAATSVVLTERALTLSESPADEAVLLLAHGMGDEDENDEVLRAMAPAAAELERHGFVDVEVATLREDWEEVRSVSEASIREWVATQALEGRSTLVIPMRLSGFGPYAEVLAGLEYEAGEGLLPHPAIGEWITRTADRTSCEAGWGPAFAGCPVAAVTDPSS